MAFKVAAHEILEVGGALDSHLRVVQDPSLVLSPIPGEVDTETSKFFTLYCGDYEILARGRDESEATARALGFISCWEERYRPSTKKPHCLGLPLMVTETRERQNVLNTIKAAPEGAQLTAMRSIPSPTKSTAINDAPPKINELQGKLFDPNLPLTAIITLKQSNSGQ